MGFRELVGVVSVATLLGCSAGADEPTPAATLPAPSTPTAAATTEPSDEPAPIDTAAVPAEIDAAYLDAVMADLDEALGDIYRDVKATGKTGEAYEAAMRTVYTNQAATDLSRVFRRSVGVRGLAKRPAPPTTAVVDVIEVYPADNPSCVYFTATRDLQPLLREPLDVVQPYYLALGLQPGGGSRRNPTAWLLAMDTYFRDGSAPRRVCETAG